MEEVLDAISKLARPIRRVLPPETLGLMFAMTLRAIPEAARLLVEARTAARARGLERSPRAVLIPAATRSVGFALQLGQALHARGIAEEAPPERRAPAPKPTEHPPGTRRRDRRRDSLSE
jgi:biotin transport system permease protein